MDKKQRPRTKSQKKNYFLTEEDTSADDWVVYDTATLTYTFTDLGGEDNGARFLPSGEKDGSGDYWLVIPIQRDLIGGATKLTATVTIDCGGYNE